MLTRQRPTAPARCWPWPVRWAIDARGLAGLVRACGLSLLSACTGLPAVPLRFDRPVVLLGEVHDNGVRHAQRLRAFETWLATGARPALVLEQFDRERQPDLDRLRAQATPPDADALIAAAGSAGWDWPFYRPFIALALKHGLPIIAANVSRDDSRKITRDGLAATGFNPAVPDEVMALQAQEIEASHCGTLSSATARRMVLAQVARDQSMAAAIEAHAPRGVLLLAGNGHVRTDAGVPRWLSPSTRARSESIGLLEIGSGSGGSFDRVFYTDAQTRADPCAAMRASGHPKGSASGIK